MIKNQLQPMILGSEAMKILFLFGKIWFMNLCLAKTEVHKANGFMNHSLDHGFMNLLIYFINASDLWALALWTSVWLCFDNLIGDWTSFQTCYYVIVIS